MSGWMDAYGEGWMDARGDRWMDTESPDWGPGVLSRHRVMEIRGPLHWVLQTVPAWKSSQCK